MKLRRIDQIRLNYMSSTFHVLRYMANQCTAGFCLFYEWTEWVIYKIKIDTSRLLYGQTNFEKVSVLGCFMTGRARQTGGQNQNGGQNTGVFYPILWKN